MYSVVRGGRGTVVLLELKHLMDFSLQKVTTNINAQTCYLELYLNKSVCDTV